MARRRARASAALSFATDPARMAVVVTLAGLDATTDHVALQRTSPSGNTVTVRGAADLPTDGNPSVVIRDWEAPLNVALHYVATLYDAGDNVVGTAEGDYTLTWTDCKAWLVDMARPTNSLALVIESFTPLDFEVPAGVHRVLDRRAPVLVTLPAWTPDAELVLLTDTLPERDALRNLLGSGYPVLLRTTPEQGVGNMYLGVTDFKEERFLTLGTRAQRRFAVEVVQVERPSAFVFSPAPPMTYQVVSETWATYADLLLAVGTYDALAYTFPDMGEGSSPLVPWLPADV